MGPHHRQSGPRCNPRGLVELVAARSPASTRSAGTSSSAIAAVMLAAARPGAAEVVGGALAGVDQCSRFSRLEHAAVGGRRVAELVLRWWRRNAIRSTVLRMGAPNNSRLSGGGETHCGHVRENNQDMIIVEPALGLYAVLDGMGGANAGDVAARMAAQEIVAFIRRKSRIRRRSPDLLLDLALNTAAVQVFAAANARPDYRGMGTTVVACLVVDATRAVIGHAGDSRAYLLRAGQLTALTRDHTSAPNVLTRNLGRAYGVRPDLLELALKPGDRLLLCSDGLYGGAPMGTIRRVLASRAAPERVAHQLVARVLKGEASDNVSAVVIAVDDRRVRAATQRPSSRTQTRRPRPSEPRKAAAKLTRPQLAGARTPPTAASRSAPGESRRRQARASRPGLRRKARRAIV
jgi:serine/threonine protein phosphatase PrpC